MVWSAWEPFEHGYMWWRDGVNWAYALNWKGGSDQTRGDWVTGGESWKWDNITYPPVLEPPPGLVEPTRGFGFVWYYKLGGPTSTIGWATFEEMGMCSKVQDFEQGMIWHSSTATCPGDVGNRAGELPAPLF